VTDLWFCSHPGALTNLTASTWCLSDASQQFWLGTYAIASAWGKVITLFRKTLGYYYGSYKFTLKYSFNFVAGLYKAVTAKSALGRRMCFALCFASRLLGFMLRISTYGGGDPEVLTHVILQVRDFTRSDKN